MKLTIALLHVFMIEVFLIQHIYFVVADLSEIEELELASNSSIYRKRLSDEFHDYNYWATKCSDFGDGWAPAVFETEEEFYFLRINTYFFIFNYDSPSYIGGSASFTTSSQLNTVGYSSYNIDDSGNSHVRIGQWSLRPGYYVRRPQLLTDFAAGESTENSLLAKSILCEKACDHCAGTNLDDWFLGHGFELSSTTKKYRKLVGRPKIPFYNIIQCVLLGEGWEEAYMNTVEEMEFIRQGQRSFSDSSSYLIGGGTNASKGGFFEYSGYVPRPFSALNFVQVSTNGSPDIFRLQSTDYYDLVPGILCQKAKPQENPEH